MVIEALLAKNWSAVHSLSTESQQEKTLISTVWLSSGLMLRGRPLHFSAGEQKQTLFPEDREKFPPKRLYQISLSVDLRRCHQRQRFYFDFTFFSGGGWGVSKLAPHNSTYGSICSYWTDGSMFSGRYPGHQHFL